MPYEKTIVCFANSRRPGGRCVAGKELIGEEFGEWVRPIGNGQTEIISEEDRRYEDGTDPAILDVIRIHMSQPNPTFHQTENHLIDDSFYWERVDTATWQDALNAVDEIDGPLWQNGDSTWHGQNDKVAENLAHQNPNSLLLIRPDNIQIHVAKEDRGTYGPPRRKVRTSFNLNGIDYKLSLTDPKVERPYLLMPDNTYPIEDAIFCISLSGIFKGYAFKLAAGMILPNTN